MKKLHLLKWAAIFFAASLFVACSDDDKKEDKKIPVGTEMVKELMSKDFGTWQYYSFDKGFATPVGTGSIDPKTGDDAKWAKRTDWDIAFNRYQIRTNGGASGSGKGAVAVVEGTDFKGLMTAPKTGYVVDGKKKVYIKMPPKGPQDQAMVGMSSASDWVKMEIKGPGHYIPTVTPTLFVLKTATGKYVKVYMKSYKNAKGETGYLSFDYAYQKDGSTSF